MALIIYPTTDYNSYVSLLDAESIYDTDIIDTAAWDLLLDPVKEKYLRQATMLIKLRVTDPLTLSTPNDLKLATVYLANHALSNNVLSDDGRGNLKRKKVDGVIEKEWFGRSASSTAFPEHIALLLGSYSYSNGSTFTLERI